MLENLRRLRGYLKMSGVASISRRYFVLNSFDGAMAILGVVVGAYSSGAINPKVVIGAGLGAAIAMGASGFSGAYLTERAERRRKLLVIRKAMLTDLTNSIHGRAMKAATIWAALIDGLSPMLTAIVPMIPFFMNSVGLISTNQAVWYSVSSIFCILFLLGAFLGKISKESMILAGVRMVFVAILVAIVSWFVGRL
jgi:predicted membrane protein (TIGR00267 family)